MSLQTVHLRVNDAADSRPTPVRLRVTDGAGTYYAPFGHGAEFPLGRGESVGGVVLLGRERWAYIDGTCEIALPPGELTVEVRKGPEYRPLREVVHLPAGKLALRFAVERWADWRAEGWFSGDTRAHFLPPHAALLEAAAEDLAVVHLLAGADVAAAADGQTYTTYPNLLAYSGQATCLERPGHQVVVGTHNTHPVLGRLGLLHTHRIVFPLTFGGPEATDDWSLTDWCGQCHRKRGLAVWTDAFATAGGGGEALANLIIGEIDALELDPTSPVRVRAWYQLLNAGVRVPVVGASAKRSNRTLLGALRTYARIPGQERFSTSAWVEAVRAGRTVVTAEPLLCITLRGLGPGDVVRVSSASPAFDIQAKARSAGPVERIELLVNGQVIAGTEASDAIDCRTHLPAGGWVAARCMTGGRLLAHTSPIYVEVEGVSPPIDPAAVAFLVAHLDRTRDWVVAEGRFGQARSRDRLLGTLAAARQALLARAAASGTIEAPASD